VLTAVRSHGVEPLGKLTTIHDTDSLCGLRFFRTNIQIFLDPKMIIPSECGVNE
jgi:hypothetical protein